MTITNREALPSDRIVDNSTYTDPAVFERELRQVYEQSWMFACHESELAQTGDYVTTTVATSPIVLTRDHDGRLRAFFNVCRHRGCKVVAQETGHAAGFRCPYHFWVYSLEGDLVGISGEESYQGTGFRKEDYPLVELRCESVLGLVFVHVAKDPIPLREWLTEAVVDTLSVPLANGTYTVESRKTYELPVNWKIYAENIRDGYHVPFVHPFFRKASPAGNYNLYDHGHAVQRLGMDPKGIEPDLWAKLRLHPLPGVEVGDGYIINIFPDLAVTLRSNVISVDCQRPVGPGNVILENRTLGLTTDDEDIREIRRLAQRSWFADPLELEDFSIFLCQQEGVATRHVPTSVIARGADAMTGTRGDDNRLRHFWTHWRALMGVERNSLR